jgi:hypothetical protein
VHIMRIGWNEYTVRDEQTDCFGLAPTKGEALADYKRMLAGELILLEKDRHRLSAHMYSQLEILRRVVIAR